MYFHKIRPQTLLQTLSRFCLNQPILQRQKSAICPENGAVHPRKTRVPPLPRRYFLLSVLRSFARWFSRQGACVSRRRWRLPGAGALVDVRALQLDQGGAPGAIYCSRAQPRDRLESLVVRAEIAHARRGRKDRKSRRSVRVAMLRGRVHGSTWVKFIGFRYLR